MNRHQPAPVDQDEAERIVDFLMLRPDAECHDAFLRSAGFYKDVARPSLDEHYGAKRKYCILEDNDPTGNQSSKGEGCEAGCLAGASRIAEAVPRS